MIKKIRAWVTNLYLLLMLGLYPLFLSDGYIDLLYKKWAMFRYVTTAAVLLSLLWLLLAGADAVRGRKDGRKSGKGSRGGMFVDCFVLVYGICVLISYAGAIDRKAALWGVDTWYMGLVSQMLFVGIYLILSRGYGKMPYLDILCAVVAVIVGGIVILQRFGVDVGHLYDGFGEDVRLNFVTTLGQVTWTSSYTSILLIAGMGVYFLSEAGKKRLFYGVCVGIGFVMELVLNCDSGVIALASATVILLWLAVGSRERMLRFMELLLIALASTAATGVAERRFAGRMAAIDSIYLSAAQSRIVYPLLAAAAVLYYFLRAGIIPVGGKRSVRLARGMILAVLGFGAAAVVVLFVLHGKGYFAGSPTENYFRFTVWWGNSRGFIWRMGAAVFSDFGPWRKLFGCGPDCFTPYAYGLMGDAINEFWHNQLVPNVHNEWFGGVINYGIIGGSAYFGIFAAAAYGYMEAAMAAAGKRRAVLFGCGLAAAGYIAHNVLCYQQLIGTPLIFILLGVGASIFRQEELRYQK